MRITFIMKNGLRVSCTVPVDTLEEICNDLQRRSWVTVQGCAMNAKHITAIIEEPDPVAAIDQAPAGTKEVS